MWAAMRRALARTFSQQSWTALPPTGNERELNVPWPNSTRRITFDDVDVVRPQAERVGGDLRIAGRVPLAVVSGADVHAHPAGRMHKHARVFPPPYAKPTAAVSLPEPRPVNSV